MTLLKQPATQQIFKSDHHPNATEKEQQQIHFTVHFTLWARKA